MNLTAILNKSKDLKIKIDEENVLNVTYNPDAFTPAVEEEFNTQLESNRSGSALASLLCSILLSWDLVDANEKAVPIKIEALHKLPISFLGACMSSISEDLNPKKTKSSQPKGSF